MDGRRLRAVSNLIEKELALHPKKRHVGFDMETYCNVNDVTRDGEPCGTAACVAGFTVMRYVKDTWQTYIDFQTEEHMVRKGLKDQVDPRVEKRWFNANLYDRAKEALRLNAFDADELFMARTVGLEAVNRNKKYVPAALRWMIKHRMINWRAALRAAKAEARA